MFARALRCAMEDLMETADERRQREEAIAAFKARGKTVQACPAGLARGTVAQKRFETFADMLERETERYAVSGLLKPSNRRRRRR
jgi:hypothetical protein